MKTRLLDMYASEKYATETITLLEHYSNTTPTTNLVELLNDPEEEVVALAANHMHFPFEDLKISSIGERGRIYLAQRLFALPSEVMEALATDPFRSVRYLLADYRTDLTLKVVQILAQDPDLMVRRAIARRYGPRNGETIH